MSFSTTHEGVNKFIGSPTLTALIQYHRAQTNSQARQPKSIGFQVKVFPL